EALRTESRTMIFYEAPHRQKEALNDMAQILGSDRHAVVCRKSTKRFESSYARSLQQLDRACEQDATMSRGELVIVVQGAAPRETTGAATLQAEELLRALLEDLSPAQAAKIAARLIGAKRAELYERPVQIKGEGANWPSG